MVDKEYGVNTATNTGLLGLVVPVPMCLCVCVLCVLLRVAGWRSVVLRLVLAELLVHAPLLRAPLRVLGGRQLPRLLALPAHAHAGHHLVSLGLVALGHWRQPARGFVRLLLQVLRAPLHLALRASRHLAGLARGLGLLGPCRTASLALLVPQKHALQPWVAVVVLLLALRGRHSALLAAHLLQRHHLLRCLLVLLYLHLLLVLLRGRQLLLDQLLVLLALLALLLSPLRVLVSGLLLLLLVLHARVVVLLALHVQSAPVHRTPVDVSLHGLELSPHALHGVSLHSRLLDPAPVLQVRQEAQE
mmetsp:Transcript_9671/g.21444  ORF Transcript_9671/g.21444 Transcript_9671/m.21444 type:complete len:303 (-) Transcript_9671:2931-3839(-)